VPVKLRRYDGIIHGFFTMPGAFSLGRQAIEEAAVELKAAFKK